MRPFFCLDLGIGPQNDAHVSGPIAVCFINNSLRQLSFRTTLERHLKIALDRYSHIFLDKNTRGKLWDRRARKNRKKKRERKTREFRF